MKIEHVVSNNTIEIKPCGDLNYYAADELSEFIRVHAKGINKMIIDLEEVNYCSSAGIRTLMEAEIKMEKLGGLILYNVNDMIMNVFKITGLDTEFTIK